jgi:isopenicillin N synthase-like dioxygenase
MATTFSSLPLVSLSALSSPSPNPEAFVSLSKQLDTVFSTTGFAYLTDLPLTYSHADVFSLCDNIFGPNGLSKAEKKEVSKKNFVKENDNTYRG